MTESEVLDNIDLYNEKLKEQQAILDQYKDQNAFQRMLSGFDEDSFLSASKSVKDFTLVLKTLKEMQRSFIEGGSGEKGFFGGLAEGLKNVERNLKTTKQLGMDFAKSIETNMVAAFDSIIKGTKTLSEGLKDLGRILIQEAMKMIIYRMIIAPFTSMFGGFLDGIGLSAPPQRQYGGSVQKGKPYMVGEAGMEMFVPNQSGTIIPNHKLGGSGTIVQNINISTGVAATVRSEIISLLPSIAEVSKGAMVDSQLRGQL